MSELAERSGVPVATVKYYLREGLLPAGEATGATRARYSEHHVERLRLIRALVEVGGMRHDRVRRVLDAVDDEEQGLAEAMGSAHTELSPEPATSPSEEATSRAAAVVRGRRWRVGADGRHAQALAAALDAMAAAGQPMPDDTLAAYADAAAVVARADLARIGGRSRAGSTTYAVLGTVLSEPVLLALRRMAHEDLARRRFPGRPTVAP